MATYYRVQGFVFKKEDQSEADRLFTLFTRDFGRVEVVARALRKITSKLRGGIELFSWSDIEFIQGKSKKTLTDAIGVRKCKKIWESPEKMEIAYGASSLLDQFVKGQEADPKIWDLLIDFFGKLNQESLHPHNYNLLHDYFFWNFVSALGHGPELFQCAHCAGALSPASLYFSCQEGGIICENCRMIKKPARIGYAEGVAGGDRFKIIQDAVKILRVIAKKDWQLLLKLKISEHLQKELQEILRGYHQHLLSIYSFKKRP